MADQRNFLQRPRLPKTAQNSNSVLPKSHYIYLCPYSVVFYIFCQLFVYILNATACIFTSYPYGVIIKLSQLVHIKFKKSRNLYTSTDCRNWYTSKTVGIGRHYQTVRSSMYSHYLVISTACI